MGGRKRAHDFFRPCGTFYFSRAEPSTKVLGYYQNANGRVNKLEISKTGNKYWRRFYNRRYEAKRMTTMFGAWKKLLGLLP
jgi:hypothetical protein